MQNQNSKNRNFRLSSTQKFLLIIIIFVFFIAGLMGYLIGLKSSSPSTKTEKIVYAEINNTNTLIPKNSYPVASFNYPVPFANPSEILYYTFDQDNGKASIFKIIFEWGEDEPVKQKLLDAQFEKYSNPSIDGIWWSPEKRYLLKAHIGDSEIYYLGSSSGPQQTRILLEKYSFFNASLNILGWIDKEHIIYSIPPDYNENPNTTEKVKYWIVPVSNIENRKSINNALGN